MREEGTDDAMGVGHRTLGRKHEMVLRGTTDHDGM